MSAIYDEYLQNHKNCVRQGYDWLYENIPDLVSQSVWNELSTNIIFKHDASKDSKEEYDAYDNYFYGNRSYAVCKAFDEAWLHHIHNNPHHWQHWVLISDEPNEDFKVLDMPLEYIVEMICDWWSFSWNKGNLYEIFDWYDKHKDYMKLSDATRKTVELILSQIKKKLTQGGN